jgi:hypothetical protein
MVWVRLNAFGIATGEISSSRRTGQRLDRVLRVSVLIVILGIFALLAASGWIVLVAPIRRLVRYLAADDVGIRVGRSEVIRWADLREIRVETTAAGPWLEDFFLVLVAGGRRPVRIPDRLVPIVLPSLQRLPSFDNETFLRATGSAEKASFLCWTCQRGTAPCRPSR